MPTGFSLVALWLVFSPCVSGQRPTAKSVEDGSEDEARYVALVREGDVHLAKKRLDQALAAFERAAEIRFEAPNFEVFGRIAEVRCMQGDSTGGLSTLADFRCMLDVATARRRCYTDEVAPGAGVGFVDNPELTPVCSSRMCGWLRANWYRGAPKPVIEHFEALRQDAGRIEGLCRAVSRRAAPTKNWRRGPLTKANAAGTTSLSYAQTRSGYFNAGRVTTVTSPGNILTSDYDALGRTVRLTRTLDGASYTVTRRYDASGRLTGISYPDGDEVGSVANPLEYDEAC
jgi:YD repeat-containing protein